MSLKYEPASEPLHIYVKYLFVKDEAGEEGGAHVRGEVIKRTVSPYSRYNTSAFSCGTSVKAHRVTGHVRESAPFRGSRP